MVAGLVVSFSFFTLLGLTLISALGLPQDILRYVGLTIIRLAATTRSLRGYGSRNAFGDAAPGQGEDKKRNGRAHGEGQGQGDDVETDLAARPRHGDGREDRSRARHVQQPAIQRALPDYTGRPPDRSEVAARESRSDRLLDVLVHQLPAQPTARRGST
ncbi:hypothetical protein OG349_03920 [Streptomyces sp. NBC_01317]|uniref:hypothetical protein n=1 Tax=Streptomyces sp. NBC_01317 TaxID=2903822 RepID=UPI002E107D3B|nr:hypothetical protein OG349_03920 [Streptomyces sp. NBC_01317]